MARFTIQSTWDGDPIGDRQYVTMEIKENSEKSGVDVEIDAPFYNDPSSPDVSPGQRCWKLWDFEVVEAFFLGENEQYLEIELCPHGQFLALMLKGRRNIVKDNLFINFSVDKLSENRWRGTAFIPIDYFPPGVTKFNAYAIHGSGDARQYEALYPVPKAKYESPDFHRLEYFSPIDFHSLFSDKMQSPSDYWK
eukprot:m.309512 g.309512  ORF g.309512 m.309512 type:complete len:194 (+) comp46735_c0_seq1:83-664(+)